MPDLREQLQTLFGLDDFRRAQREVIEDVLAGRDVLCVMPTGAGKSLCYQLPAAIALTATATDDVRADIIHQLAMPEPRIYITGFDRPNLRYEAHSLPKVREKDEHLLRILRHEQGSGIVYCSTRKNVDAMTSLL